MSQDDIAAPDPQRFPPPPLAEQERMVEAILFASAEPMSQREIAARLPAGCDVGEAVQALRARYEGRGVQLARVGDAWAFRTAADLGFLMQESVVESRRLSRAATETLAIIAYHQPVTRAEIEEIRGVAVSRGTLDQLIELDWVRIGRRRQTPGRPVTFVVTEAFLDHFGLESARDLPGLAELRAAGLLESRPPGEGLAPGLFGEEGADEAEAMAEDLFEDE
ncbi:MULTISPECIES: SMC-Scp complex subunit ScpB [Paracoccus]|jgi:segregation and condensation protein B|uniref:Condensin subunit ScpB n=1 Tax=Paracoccus denitrificans (strain Pd 1222) TaxID=318586 RepID=A1B369_PARDP|nr:MULTISPECIES: SMC-Scp complex subunit ScpB [Paracoccus]ABL69963.1 condensin subunit ScpB [Paracoccus denitrificans PD1222]MBB4627044.1 segregation and condensation protein B [Paracoccus denitrificans]MCU7428430.1 SMC-Scp complex subunit ScpB [Paracoccus denitrificans]MDK8871596.1 SMC-Scp complex subunit ScpB [Paracoccus sp. SSJ]QAR25349.1 SMC-Scp complex subunit ScpB [Paracoccus denitrificans]